MSAPGEHRVAVVDSQPGDERRLAGLSSAVPTDITSGAPGPQEIVRRPSGATVLVTLYTYTSISADVLAQLPDVTLVATRTAGYSHIDVAAAARLGIAVAAVPDAPTTAVKEYTMGCC